MEPRSTKILTCSALAILVSLAPFKFDWTANDGVQLGSAKLFADDDDDRDDNDSDRDDDDNDRDDDDSDRDDDDNDRDDGDNDRDDDDDRDDGDDDRIERSRADYLSVDDEAVLISKGWE